MPALRTRHRPAPGARIGRLARSERPQRWQRAGPVLAAVVALAVVGCEDIGGTGTEPVDPPNLVGSWRGTFLAGGEEFAANFSFSQSGLVVGGTAAIDQLLPTSPIEGAIDQAGRVVMLIENDCEDWFGTFEVSPGNDAMEGLLQVDRASCSVGANDVGRLSLRR